MVDLGLANRPRRHRWTVSETFARQEIRTFLQFVIVHADVLALAAGAMLRTEVNPEEFAA